MEHYSCKTDFGQILWSGCKDDQTSADTVIKGKHEGAMTYVSFLYRAYRFGLDLTDVLTKAFLTAMSTT